MGRSIRNAFPGWLVAVRLARQAFSVVRQQFDCSQQAGVRSQQSVCVVEWLQANPSWLYFRFKLQLLCAVVVEVAEADIPTPTDRTVAVKNLVNMTNLLCCRYSDCVWSCCYEVESQSVIPVN